MFKLLSALLLLASAFQPLAAQSITEIVNESEDFTILASVLNATGLDVVLDDLDSVFTVFAPTDEAFGLLPDGVLESLTVEQATAVLLYHVIPGFAYEAEAVIELAPAEVGTALEGQNVSITFVDDETVMVNQATVIIPDVEADNGIVHVIDQVLLPTPPEETPEPTLEATTEGPMETDAPAPTAMTTPGPTSMGTDAPAPTPAPSSARGVASMTVLAASLLAAGAMLL